MTQVAEDGSELSVDSELLTNFDQQLGREISDIKMKSDDPVW
jgi:hypothetical protein